MSALYDKAREKFLGHATIDLDWINDNIKAVLVDTGAYTVDLVNHEFLSDIAGAARIATSANLGTKTASAGVADAADVTFTAVTGATVEAIVLYKDTGVAGTSPLVAYIDAATGLPLTPNGGDVTIQWDNGANKIFKL
jgi:predicted dehydrogenase